MSIASLKEKARNHEQREEWKAALDTYIQAIQKLDDDQSDIGLHNRVGDIAIRLGQIDRAAEHYSQSVDLYVEAELPNNAIAVCKKIIRNIPTRTDVYLKMGQIRASQGFLTDARSGFLTYAERKQQEGDLEEAFRALIEFADLAPEETEIRLSLAARLHAHERTDEAVEQLLEARAAMIVLEREDGIADVEAMISEYAPGQELPDPETIRAEAAESASHGAFEPDALALGDEEDESEEAEPATPEEDSGEEAASEAAAMEGLEATSMAAEAAEASEASAEAPETTEEAGETLADADERAATLAAAEPAFEATEQPVEAEVDDVEAAEGLEELAQLAEAFDSFDGDGEEEDLEPSVIVDAEDDSTGLHEILDDWAAEESADDTDDEDEPVDLPLMDFGSGAEGDGDPGSGEVLGDDWLTQLTVDTSMPDTGAVRPDAASLSATVIDSPALDSIAPATLLEQGLAAMAAGRPDDGVSLLEQAHAELAGTHEFGQALEAVQALAAHAPDRLEYHQRAVEYAFQINEKSVLAEAYLNLARCLGRTGDGAKARAVYQQVLGVDPENVAARAALGGTQVAEPPPAVEVASSEDYVDLGALVFDEEESEKTTRWVVEMADPSGDDEADFAKMLTQFKAKVAEHLEADDVRAHYDLGTAYREMGLVDEAIAEFQQALRGSSDHLPTYELIGQCFMEKGQYEVAIRSMNKALSAPYEVEDELLGIYYYLGRAHEELGSRDTATEFYEKIFALDINFRDVTERLRALR